MKAGKVLFAVGFIFFLLNLITFIGFEKKAKIIESLEATLTSLLDNATVTIQKGPPPIGMRVIGVYIKTYGTNDILDVVSAIGIWNGSAFTHTSNGSKSFTYAVDYQYPDEWVPYP
jgi:hypothetical protein